MKSYFAEGPMAFVHVPYRFYLFDNQPDVVYVIRIYRKKRIFHPDYYGNSFGHILDRYSYDVPHHLSNNRDYTTHSLYGKRENRIKNFGKHGNRIKGNFFYKRTMIW